MGRANDITLIGKLNRAQVYEFLFRNGDSSIQQIADALGLSLPAVTRAIEIGLNQNLFESKGLVGGDRGRRAMYYGLNPDKGHSISFYIGKDTISVFEKDFTATTLSEEVLDIDTENVVDLIENTVERYKARNDKLKFIFVVISGDVHEGRIISCHSHKNLEGFNMKQYLVDRFGMIVVVENDMTAAVTSGFKYSPDPRNEIIVTFLFGKDILGAGVMIDQVPYKGSKGRQLCFDALPSTRLNKSYLAYVGNKLQTVLAMFNPDTVILYPMDDRITCEELKDYIRKNMSEDFIPEFYEWHNFIESCITGMVRLCIEEVKKIIADHELDGDQYKVLD